MKNYRKRYWNSYSLVKYLNNSNSSKLNKLL